MTRGLIFISYPRCVRIFQYIIWFNNHNFLGVGNIIFNLSFPKTKLKIKWSSAYLTKLPTLVFFSHPNTTEFFFFLFGLTLSQEPNNVSFFCFHKHYLISGFYSSGLKFYSYFLNDFLKLGSLLKPSIHWSVCKFLLSLSTVPITHSSPKKTSLELPPAFKRHLRNQELLVQPLPISHWNN